MEVAFPTFFRRANASSGKQVDVRGRTDWSLCSITLLLALTLIHFFLPAPGAVGQTSSDEIVTGVVVDAQTGAPLSLANVLIVGENRGATTGDNGRFTLRDVSTGAQTLLVSYVGFETARKEINVQRGERLDVRVELRPVEMEVEGVMVTGRRVEERALGTETITPDDVQNLPTVLEPDLFRTLQLLPGVKSASDFSTGLYIRGGSPDQTLIRLDEATIYNPTHVFGFFSTFNPDAVGDVVLYKGGYPAQYGGRLGAVVDIANRRGEKSATRGGASLGLLASRAYGTGPYEIGGRSGTWMAAARRSTIEPLLSGLQAAEVQDIPEGFYFWDINVATRVNLTERDQLFVSLYAGRDQLDFPFLRDVVFDIGYGNRAGTVSWRRVIGQNLTTRLSVTGSHYFADPRADIANTQFVRDNDVFDFATDARATLSAGDHTVEAGFRAGRFVSRLRNYFNGDRNYSPSFRTPYGSLYLQDTYRPTSDWTLTGGMRASYFGQGKNVRFAPRLSLEHRLSDWLWLQAGYGRYYQYLTAASTELFSAFDFWLTTDDQVPPAYGDQFVAGVKTEPKDNLRVDLELYYRTLRDLFEFDRLYTDYTGLDYPEVFRFGNGYAAGAELMIRRDAGTVNGFISYALSRTRREFDRFEGGRAFSPKYDRLHDLTTVLRYDVSENWRATAVFTYATGQAYTEPSGYYKLVDDPTLSRPRDVFQAEYNASRLPAYHRLDLGVRRKGDFFGVGTYEARMQVVNVYGRRNIWFVIFEPTQGNTIERNIVPQIPVPLPNLSLTVSF
ncbi:TonB-dependent receptor [Longibacter salinarum]|uniref:TonB-dependent receptor n=1 Tax=Longibacter salinarum TaxID=1850348 RepID=A0A2A8CYT2_9BACT|nr:TonB-dependent receptor [Longibacter salinarum]PEN13790.1 TonB-dependent receptor [Longibacter salinarum]